MGKVKELAMEEEEKKWDFAEQEHKGGQHDTFQEGCPMCSAESKTLQGLPVGTFNFENVIKMVGNINLALYGKNPYENKN